MPVCFHSPPHIRGCFGFGNSLGTISPWGSKRPMSQYKEDKKTLNWIKLTALFKNMWPNHKVQKQQTLKDRSTQKGLKYTNFQFWKFWCHSCYLRGYKVENCFFFNFVKLPVMVSDRPFAALDHLLGYHLAMPRWISSHPNVYSDHKALSAIEQSIPNFI